MTKKNELLHTLNELPEYGPEEIEKKRVEWFGKAREVLTAYENPTKSKEIG